MNWVIFFGCLAVVSAFTCGWVERGVWDEWREKRRKVVVSKYVREAHNRMAKDLEQSSHD